MLLLYLVFILYLFKISIFYMKINLATAIHCGVLFHGGSWLTEALVMLEQTFYFTAQMVRQTLLSKTPTCMLRQVMTFVKVIFGIPSNIFVWDILTTDVGISLVKMLCTWILPNGIYWYLFKKKRYLGILHSSFKIGLSRTLKVKWRMCLGKSLEEISVLDRSRVHQ